MTAVQTMNHVGSSLLPLPWVTHNNNSKPRRLVVGLSASVCTHDDDNKAFELTTTAVQTMSHVGSSLVPLPWVTHNNDGKPRRLVVGSSASVCTHDDIICNVNPNPTPSHTTASWGGIFWTNYDSGADDEPCRLITAAPTLGDTQRRRQAT